MEQQSERIPAASLRQVRRPQIDARGAVVMDGDKPKLRAVREDEVLSFRDTASEVVVVTVDGQKYRAEKSA